MTLKPITDSLYNVMNLIDESPTKVFSGEDFSKANTGVDSYTLDRAVDEKYLLHDSTKNYYRLTTKGVGLLNHIKLRKAIERFDKVSKISSWVMIGLTITMLILTGGIAWLTRSLVR